MKPTGWIGPESRGLLQLSPDSDEGYFAESPDEDEPRYKKAMASGTENGLDHYHEGTIPTDSIVETQCEEGLRRYDCLYGVKVQLVDNFTEEAPPVAVFYEIGPYSGTRS